MNKNTFISFLNSKSGKLVLFLSLFTFLVFVNSLKNEFTNWDDDEYVTGNIHITDLSFDGVISIFSVYVSCHYHPFTLLSLAFDYHIWGLNPAGYIFHNILLHIFNCILIFLIFLRLTGKIEVAFITALLFSVHPFRTESVVWISERKDVLSFFFIALAVLSYLKYLNSGCRIKYYLIVLLFFLAALFSKVSAAVLPLLLLLFDYFTERKFSGSIFFEKVPFFLLALFFGVIALDAQSSAESNYFPLFDNFFLATYAFVFYMIKFFVPFWQSAIIPFPEKIFFLFPIKYYLSALVIPFFIFLPIAIKKHRKVFVFSMLLFVLPLLPVLIEFPVGPAYLAERYTYIPHIGIAFLVAHFYSRYTIKNKLKHNFKNSFFVVLCLFVAFISLKTVHRNNVWTNNRTLFSDVINKNYNVPIAHLNLGNIELELENFSSAIFHYNNAINTSKSFKRAYLARGFSYLYMGNYQSAILDFSKVLQLDSLNSTALLSRAACYNYKNDFRNALNDLNLFITLDSTNSQVYNNRGGVYLSLNKLALANSDFDKAIKYDSANYLAYFNRGIINEQNALYDNALVDYSKSIELNPSFSKAYNSRGVLKGRVFNDLSGAEEDFNIALDIDPDKGLALNNLVFIYLIKGDTLEACGYLNRLNSLGYDISDSPIAGKCFSVAPI